MHFAGVMVPAVRIAVAFLIAALALVGARLARSAAVEMGRSSADAAAEAPFAPSADAAPFVALGYREAAADLLYVRMIGYFAGNDSDGAGVADLVEAIVALNPRFHRVYDHGANAITLAKSGVTQSVLLRALAILEMGARQFPADWRFPYVAGQIYTQDLKSDDPAQRRIWDEKGTLLIESAIRKPDAPQKAAVWAAMMRTKMGQRDRAVAGLRELLLVTNDETTRRRLIEDLAKIEERDAASIAGEIHEQRRMFDRQWRSQRPVVTASMYILVGPRSKPGFDMTELATGGRDLTVQQASEPLEPLE